RGVEVNERTLALDVIHAVGPRGTFLDQEHTVEQFKREIWQPGLFERRTFDAWKEDGAKDLFARLNARVKEILKTHRPEPLAKGADKKIAKILADREKLKEAAARGA
ncbi:MAG: trimethylamine methyltransferase family protein, partial [Planctomycetota bacterium]